MNVLSMGLLFGQFVSKWILIFFQIGEILVFLKSILVAIIWNININK
jgi:hypothetical protein